DIAVVVRVEEADPASDPDRVRVDHKGGMAARVEEDRIRGLRAHAALREQVLAHGLERAIEVSAQIASRASQEVAADISEPRRLRSVQARDLHVLADDGDRSRGKRSHVEEARLFQVTDRFGHIPPGSLLHEERADDHLERRIRGPPMLRPVMAEEPMVDLPLAVQGGGRCSRWPRGFLPFAALYGEHRHRGRVHAFVTFASGGLDETIFRALNLAGTDPVLDRVFVFFTILTGVYVIFLVAVPLWLKGLREATFDVLLVLGITILVSLGLHWPSDILGGAVVGIALALLVEYVSRRVGLYQRIRRRIVEAIPHLRRRTAYVRRPFAFTRSSSIDFTI